MMVVLLIALAQVAAGPAMRLGPTTPDGTATVEVLDSDGEVATRVSCPANVWIEPRDLVRSLVGSTAVMAEVIAHDGRIERLEQLGPARFACIIDPPAIDEARPSESAKAAGQHEALLSS